MSIMYSRVKIAGHPIHPMLIAFPVTFYATTVFAFVVYAASGEAGWWQIALRANVAGVITAIVAAVPGFVDWATGIPPRTQAKSTGRLHMLANVGALLIFTTNLIAHRNLWEASRPDPGGAIVLSALGLLLTGVAGFLGFTLVQTHHVGIELTDEQERLERRATLGR